MQTMLHRDPRRSWFKEQTRLYSQAKASSKGDQNGSSDCLATEWCYEEEFTNEESVVLNHICSGFESLKRCSLWHVRVHTNEYWTRCSESATSSLIPWIPGRLYSLAGWVTEISHTKLNRIVKTMQGSMKIDHWYRHENDWISSRNNNLDTCADEQAPKNQSWSRLYTRRISTACVSTVTRVFLSSALSTQHHTTFQIGCTF